MKIQREMAELLSIFASKYSKSFQNFVSPFIQVSCQLAAMNAQSSETEEVTCDQFCSSFSSSSFPNPNLFIFFFYFPLILLGL